MLRESATAYLRGRCSKWLLSMVRRVKKFHNLSEIPDVCRLKRMEDSHLECSLSYNYRNAKNTKIAIIMAKLVKIHDVKKSEILKNMILKII